MSSIRCEGKLSGFDACFFCLGTSSNGLSEEAYRKITIDLSLNFAKKVLALTPDISFTFVSAEGADIIGKAIWARVKAEAEKSILDIGFKEAFIF